MRTLYSLAAFVMATSSSLCHSQNVIELRTSSGLSLSPVAGQRVNILNTTVPAGDWVATAKGSAVNWGNRDYVRCILVFDGTVVDGSTTMTGEAQGAPAAALLFSQAKLSTVTDKPLSFQCSHDRAVSGQKIGRVEMWRGDSRSGLSVAAPFVWRCPSNLAVAPFPHPAHRTGLADFPHPALGQDITLSPTTRRASGWPSARA
jgi:hypothetical protein